MLAPAEQNGTIYRGATWELLLELWADKAHTKPYDLTDAAVTCTLWLPEPLALTEGHGVTVTLGKEASGDEEAEPAAILAELSAEQTEAIEAASGRYLVAFTRGGKVSWLLKGTQTVEGP